MSLVIRLSINDSAPIEFVAARRISDQGEDPDSVNIYEIRRFDTGLGHVRQVADAATVSHRYGDGAAVLARKALEATT